MQREIQRMNFYRYGRPAIRVDCETKIGDYLEELYKAVKLCRSIECMNTGIWHEFHMVLNPRFASFF